MASHRKGEERFPFREWISAWMQLSSEGVGLIFLRKSRIGILLSLRVWSHRQLTTSIAVLHCGDGSFTVLFQIKQLRDTFFFNLTFYGYSSKKIYKTNK